MPAPISSLPRLRSRGVVVLSHSVLDAAVVVFSGTLCATDRDAVEAPIDAALVRGHRHVVLDMHELRDADPYGIWVIASVVQRAIRRGATVSAVGIRPGLAPRIEPIVGDGLRLHPTVRSAIAAVGADLDRHPPLHLFQVNQQKEDCSNGSH